MAPHVPLVAIDTLHTSTFIVTLLSVSPSALSGHREVLSGFLSAIAPGIG